MSPYYRMKAGKARQNANNGQNSQYYREKDDVDTHSATTASSGDLPVPAPPMQAPRTNLKKTAALFIPGQPALTSQAPPFIPGGSAPQASPPAGWAPPDGRPCGAAGATQQAPPGWTPPDCRPCGGGEVNAPPPWMADGGQFSSGKDCLKDNIQSALGSELWDLSMVDCQAFDGQWYTNVDVVVPALNASMCHLVTSGDMEAVAAAQVASQFTAMQCVCNSLQNLSPKVTVTTCEDSPQLSVQYCAADHDKLCWEFAHHGHCPRGSTCKWAHAMIETFMINFLLQPLTSFGVGSPTNEAPDAYPVQGGMPAPPASQQNDSSTLTGLKLTSISNTNLADSDCQSDPDETPWPDHVEDQSFHVKGSAGGRQQIIERSSKDVTPTLRSRNPSRKMWADIQEDSDDEPLAFT